jgi:hypothetical protein
MAETEAVEYARGLPITALHRAFVFIPGERPDGDEGEDDESPPSGAPTSVDG